MSVDRKSGLIVRKEVQTLSNYAALGTGSLGIGAFAATDAKILPIWVSLPGMALLLGAVLVTNYFRRRKEARDAGLTRKTK
jgi:hypothetical protein